MAKGGNNNQNLKPFKKGQSGNPLGYKKGQKNRDTDIKKWLKVAANVEHPESGEIVKGTFYDKIAVKLLLKAAGGDIQAIKEIYDTLYGKIPDKQQLTGAGGKDLTLIITGIEYIIPNEDKTKSDV